MATAFIERAGMGKQSKRAGKAMRTPEQRVTALVRKLLPERPRLLRPHGSPLVGFRGVLYVHLAEVAGPSSFGQ